MDGLTEGRMVHYVLSNGQHRPAIVVKVWKVTEQGGVPRATENGLVNLTVFVDGRNDILPSENTFDPKNPDILLLRVTSVLYSEEPKLNTWHWIEKA